jgi:hypothetical protein
MSDEFTWRDRSGHLHLLRSSEPIEAEAQAIALQIDGIVDLGSDDQGRFTRALEEARPLWSRLDQLSTELERWDRFVAAKLAALIGQLKDDAEEIRLLHSCYAQQDSLMRSGDLQLLAGEPTRAQLAVIARVMKQTGAAVPASLTRGMAHEWLTSRAETNRAALPRDLPTFEWQDRHGHVHQLRSLLPIEAEKVEVTGLLEQILPDLQPGTSIERVRTGLERARPLRNRLLDLESQADAWVGHVTAIARAQIADWKARRRGGESSDTGT